MPLYPAPTGWSTLATARFSASATTSPVLTFPAYEMLDVRFNIAGYSGSAIASLRFNGDTTVGNYSSHFAIGTSTTATSTLGTFAGLKLGQNGTTNRRNGMVSIYNVSDTVHPCTVQSLTGAAANTAPVLSIGGGNYVTSAASQITSIQLIVDTASVTMPAGTSIAIFGLNPS